MTADDLLMEFSIKIYEPPLSDIRDTGAIADLSNPISVVMLIIDFRTEIEMNGILDFIGNSTGLYAQQTVTALELIDCQREAQVLRDILSIAERAGMTHEAIQADRAEIASGEEFVVTSFTETHGDKWDTASDRIVSLEETIDLAKVEDNAARFVENHRAVFEKALA